MESVEKDGPHNADEDDWSAAATEWARLFGRFSDPARQAVIAASGIGTGSRVLDVGCGSGELLEMLRALGASVAGADPASGMLELAARRNPGTDLRSGTAETLPWPDDSFDAVTAINSLQFSSSVPAALAELARVTVRGGVIAVSNWAEGELNDLNVIEAAVAQADGEELPPDGELREAGRLERLFRAGGIELVDSGLVDVRWEVPDDATLIAGVLLGEAAERSEFGRVVVTAAQPFRTPSGGYSLLNRFRYVVGRLPRR